MNKNEHEHSTNIKVHVKFNMRISTKRNAKGGAKTFVYSAVYFSTGADEEMRENGR